MKLRLHAYDLPLRHTFTISRESITSQQTLIVELEHGGYHGYGEATANEYYGFTIEGMSQAIAAAQGEIAAAADALVRDPAEFWDQLAPRLKDNPFAQCAVDQAAYDLWGKLRGQKVHEAWGLKTKSIPASNYTLGIDKIDVMVAKLAEFPDWPIYKIKLGTERDIDIVRELRKHTSAIFRVDANCSWTADQAVANAPLLKDLGVEFIEQPLPADRWEDYRRLHAESALPIIADESCIVERDVEKCAGLFHGINIKLVKCGGLTPARRMIARARQLGLKVMVGCMTESTVGISAIAQLLPLLDYVDMDGAVLLAHDIADGTKVIRGICHYSAENGSGVTLLEEGRNPLT
jgi:L-Ala-D/L-Glu epimerase